MKKIKQIELLEERLAELELKHSRQAELTGDLLDYLMRVDPNFSNNPGIFEGWYERLLRLRNEEITERECQKAKRVLEENGYIVASDLSEVDAAKMKKWVSTKIKDDDDIPF